MTNPTHVSRVPLCNLFSCKSCAVCTHVLKSMHYIIQVNENKTMHFILIDGTWSNSSAMFRRLQVRNSLGSPSVLVCHPLILSYSFGIKINRTHLHCGPDLCTE